MYLGVIWYSGHGVKGSGDWVFCDGAISFSDIYDIYIKHFHGEILYIVTDCCFAGQWVQNLAKCLTSQNIGACGHYARDRGILIKIMAACQPDESAIDGAYSERAVFIDASDKHLTFDAAKMVMGTVHQTSCFLDTTKIRCSNLPDEECNWPIVKLCQLFDTSLFLSPNTP